MKARNKTCINLKNPEYQDLEILKIEKLYKSYAYAVATLVGLETIDSYLILSSEGIIPDVLLSNPVQVRVDYKHYNECKPMGGVTIYNLKIVPLLIKRLLNRGFYPIFTPDPKGTLSRYKNLYSFNVLVSNNNIVIEAVGPGFDLSDLKRGDIIPHETIIIDKKTKQVLKRNYAKKETYLKSLEIRKIKLKYLLLYEKFANMYGLMLERLDRYKCLLDQLEEEKHLTLPSRFQESYSPIPEKLLKMILGRLDIMEEFINNIEIPTTNVIFSYSYSKESGLVLWDVYGEWYIR